MCYGFLVCITYWMIRPVRVLTLWFDYGHWPEVNEALVEGIKTIQIDTWLQVTRHYSISPSLALTHFVLFPVT